MGTATIFSYSFNLTYAMIVYSTDSVADDANPHTYDWEQGTRAPPPGDSLDPSTLFISVKMKKFSFPLPCQEYEFC